MAIFEVAKPRLNQTTSVYQPMQKKTWRLLATLLIAISVFILLRNGTTNAVAALQEEAAEAESDQEVADSTKPDKRIGIVAEKPASGRFVKTAQGYMVPYKTMIPGTDVEFEMVPIEGGSFKIGSPADETDRSDDEGPQFEVEIEPFWMGKYEVTWAEYQRYMRLDQVFKAFQFKGVRTVKSIDGVDAITAPSSLYEPTFTYEAGEDPKQPAATMSQFAAKQYTKWLSLLSNDFYRLPTEAEWEYACRAGTTTRYYFGDDEDELEDHAWYEENSEELRHEVGELKPNPWGLYDMYGNVAEWTLDQLVADGYKKHEGKKLPAMEAWERPTKVYPRVLRGGSWELEAKQCRSAARLGSDEEWRDEDPNYPQSPWWLTTSPGLGAGFRLIRPLDAPKEMKERDKFWSADVARIMKDAKNRINDNGRGAFGIVDEELPKAIKQLTNEDR